MITELTAIFGSKTKAQEILFLLKDAKIVVRQGFYPEELPLIENFCLKQQIFLVKSKFKVILEGNLFSDKGIRIPEHDPQTGIFFVYLSKDEQQAYLAAYYELIQNQQELGLLLGYPRCCVGFFCNNFCEQNPNLELASKNGWTNLSQRKYDCVLLSHFPCHGKCQASISLAKNYFKIIAENDSERALELQQKLELS